MREKKVGFSKVVTVISIILFCIVLWCSFHYSLNTYLDATFAAVAITVTGSICGTCIVWMLKKSQSENLIKIRMGMYGDIKDAELKYNEEMFKLIKKYEITEDELMKIKDSGNIDDFAAGIISEMDSLAMEHSADSDSSIEMQNFG